MALAQIFRDRIVGLHLVGIGVVSGWRINSDLVCRGSRGNLGGFGTGGDFGCGVSFGFGRDLRSSICCSR